MAANTGEAELKCSIDRCLVGPPIVCADANVFEKGQVEVAGTNLICIVAAAADGATQRAVDIAAGRPARPDRWTPIYQAEDVVMDKLPGVDSIAIGTKLWFSVDDNALVDSLSDVDAAGACYLCAVALELSDDVNDTIRVAFNGYDTVSEAGTG